MKVLVYCSDTEMEKRLCNKIHSQFSLSGIVIEKKVLSHKLNFLYIVNGIINRFLFYTINHAWNKAQDKITSDYSSWPEVSRLEVDNINSKETLKFSNNTAYDIIVVSSTSLIREPLINIKSKLGMVNLHTGLSPYIRGGPNCTNWCLANRDYSKIGNTVMYLDAGIDSGKIIKSRLLALNKHWTHSEILYQTLVQGQNLYLETLGEFESENGHLPSFQQDLICEGITYYNKQWGLKPRLQLIFNIYFGHYKAYVGSEKYRKDRNKLKTVG